MKKVEKEFDNFARHKQIISSRFENESKCKEEKQEMYTRALYSSDPYSMIDLLDDLLLV